MVIEVYRDHPGEPLTHDLNRLVASTFQLIPNTQQRRAHSLLDRQAQYLEPAASVGTTTVREAEEVKCLRFPLPRFLRFLAAKRPNSISRVCANNCGVMWCSSAVNCMSLFLRAASCTPSSPISIRLFHHLDTRFVAVDNATFQQLIPHQVEQGLQVFAALDHPARQGLSWNIDVVAT